MSLSAQNRKVVWEEHKDSLRRLQSRVSDEGTPTNRYSPQRGTPPQRYSPQRGTPPQRYSPQKTPPNRYKNDASPRETGRRSHSPYGKYRKQTSPAYLHRIETPPDHDRLRNKGKLRGSKYGVVPPVQKRHHQTPDYDSWGEETDDDSEEEQNYVMPQPYPYPAYGYPAYQPPNGHPPPQVVFGAPFPIYYPPPPQYGYKNKRARDRRSKRNEEKQPSVHHSQPTAGRKSKQKSQRVHYSLPEYNGYGHENHIKSRRDDIFDPYRNDVLRRYKYIEPHQSPYTPDKTDDIVSRRYQDDPPRNHPFYHKSESVCDQIIEEALPDLTHEAVKLAMAEMVGDYMGFSHQKPMEERINELVATAPQVGEVDVSDNVFSVYEDFVNDYIKEVQEDVVNDVMMDIAIEDIIEEELIVLEVDEEAPEVAQEVLSQYDSKIERRELKEVSKQAGDKLQESIILDYILSMIASQGRVWSESDHANKYLDDLLLDLLIEQFYTVKEHRDKTVSSNPLRKLHEKVTTEVAVDLLLQHLTSSLDEDLADVDEYERGVDGSQNTIKTPIIPKTTHKR